MDRARAGWVVLAVVAAPIAVAAIARWVWAVTLAGPVLYSEGAVAHAALLARHGLEYAAGAAVLDGPMRPIFTAANYPPTYFRVAGLADPFVVGRAVSVVATIFVASAIAWRARAGGALVAGALAAAWLASFPVVVWGAAVKPDLVALALTVGGSLALTMHRPVAAGASLALAIWTKPTALLPALALGVWCVLADRRAAVRYLAASAAGLVGLGVLLIGPSFAEDLLRGACCGWARHVVAWNALPWSLEQVGLLVVLALVTVGLLVLVPTVMRGWRGPVMAYGIAAAGVLVLGGREGATVNYLLDLSAAGALALAGVAVAARAAVVPIALAAQLVLGVALLDPFGVLPGRVGTGAWGDPSRIDAVRSLPAGSALVEDAGLLVANGRGPIVDDLFLWSRNHALRAEAFTDPQRRGATPPFEEGIRLIDAVRRREFVAVVAEVDLERLDEAPAYARSRWHPDLVRAVLDAYTLDRTAGALWVYRPR